MASDIEQQSATDTDEKPAASTRRSCLCSSLRIISKALKYVALAVAATLALALAIIVLACLTLLPGSIAAGFAVGILLSPLALMVLFSLPKNKVFGKDAPATTNNSSSVVAAIYQQSRSKDTFFRRVMMGSFSLVARSGLVLLAWLVLNLSVPSLKSLTLLGSPLWRWSLLGVTVTAGYFQAMTIYLIPGVVKNMIAMLPFAKTKTAKQRISHDYLYFGLFPSMSLVIYFGMVLVSWLLYFRTEHGLKHASTPHPVAFEYVTWTCISLFVGSVLLFMKTLLLLRWRADAIYRRFEPRILITGLKFFYLGAIVGGFFENQIVSGLELLDEYGGQSENFNFTNYIMSKKLDISYLQRIGRLLGSLAATVRPLKEDGVPDVVDFFRNKITQTDHKCERDNLLDLLRYTDKPDLFRSEEHRDKITSVLYGIVKEQCARAPDEFTFDDLKKWMVDAHKNCVNMGRTLTDASAMVTRLDIFISCIIFVAVVLLWLLITGIATTKVLVTIATPLLALTFIFGDSAKTFFQGIIFCFATHAFDVGDRCILDEIELEVKSIGILTTTFIKIGSKEKRVMYPNSVLATKAIVNLGWQPDPTDVVELTLDFSTTPTQLQKLETKLQQFFGDPQQKGLFEKTHDVMMKEIGDKIKVTIHFTHVLNIKEMTHGQCLYKKNKQRSTFLKKINHFLDHGGESKNSQVLITRTDPDQPAKTS